MNKFEKAYGLIKDDLGCSKNCKICEEGSLQFLPGEVEFLSKKLRIAKNKLAHSYQIDGHIIWLLPKIKVPKIDKHCPFYKFGKCIKRYARPLDCRSYPLLPYLKKGKLSVKLDKQCPLVKQKKIKKEFIRRAFKAWKIVNPPKWWIEIYKNI